MVKVLNGLDEPVCQSHFWFPGEGPLGCGNVGPTLAWVVLGQWLVIKTRFGPGQLEDQLGQFLNGEFVRVAQVDRTCHCVRGVHEPDKSLNHIIDVTERSALVPLAINSDRFVQEGLNDEVGDHPPVVGVHVWPVRIENAGHFDEHGMLTPIIEKVCPRAPRDVLVAGTIADWVHVSCIALRLGVDSRVAVNLAGGSLKDFGPDAFGQAQHVDGPVDACLGRLDRIELIVDRRCRAGQIEDFVDLYIQGKGDVVADELKGRVMKEMAYEMFAACVKIVHTQDFMALRDEPLAKVGSEKAGSTSDQNAFTEGIAHDRSNFSRKSCLFRTAGAALTPL